MELASRLEQLIGKRCVGFSAGAGAGSVIDLEFGLRRPRRKPLTNPFLTEEQRLGEPDISLFVKCVWRLDSDREVICGAWDDNSHDGIMLGGLNALVGKQVLSFNLDEPGLDLSLKFDNYWTLRIFCDQVNEDDGDDNYSIYSMQDILTVTTKSRLVREDREE
jgi:hypothetical protein